MYTLVNQVSVKPLNCNVGYVNSWLSVMNNAQREFCAQAAYITNFEDLMITLSAGNVNIGAVEIKDWNSNLRADVISDGGYNALRVLSQDLESSVDDITIGDRDGNFATINTSHSALNVYFTNISALATNQRQDITNSLLNSLTSLNQREFNETQTLLIGLTSLQNVKQNEIITLVNKLTANTDAVESLLDSLTSVNSQVLQKSENILTYFENLSTFNYDVTVTNPVTSVSITNPVILDPNYDVSIKFANNANIDAFGRLRISSPLTLFDSSHRYKDNNLWSSLTAVNGTYSFNQNQGLIDLTVNDLSGSSVIRETTKVFPYQPGKSLQTMNTFVMAPSSENLRQRVGYFGENNGIYFQLDGNEISFVERSLVNGSPATETIIPRSSWNGDKLDGLGSSKFTFNITKAQIFWMDIEWLGVGTVRCGFVINGQFIVCHSFHHANIIDSTYTTTASLPLRYEITNKAQTEGSHTLKQICSTVISEGGYELRGLQQAVSIPITSPITFAATNIYYPIISIRLKTVPDRMDAVVILTALSILGKGNGINYNWQIRASGISTGGSWLDAGVDSAVEYNITGTSYSGGRILASGFLNASNQASPNIDILKEALFKFQLERNGLTKTPYEITLVASTDTTNGSGIFASMDWEEVTR
jgi:hypothetical protein